MIELAPTRVNVDPSGDRRRQPAVGRHAPGAAQALVDRTPIGRLVTMAEVVDASRFLLENEAMNGINLAVDGGWMCM